LRLNRLAPRTRARRGSIKILGRMAIIAAVLSGCGQAGPLLVTGRLVPPVTARTCVYSGNTLSGLAAFDRLVNAQIGCVVVFADAAPDWASWERPWFIGDRNPDQDWTSFGSQPGHHLIITINLIPAALATGDWRAIGAAGGYAPYARTLAENLIAAGLGDATIRLGHEANGDWYPDNVGTSLVQWSQWRLFWRATVLAMRSVPGSHFKFNWCIAAGYRAIPFTAYYPGDDVVDSIGVDIYDTGVPAGADRWTYQLNRAGGVGAIERFASAHRKPLSIPEWGLAPASSGGAGDDPTFTDGIVSLARSAPLSFQAYFFAHGSRLTLMTAQLSRGIYDLALLQP
jgi:Glycosyl hydrolase family 26